MSDTSNKVTKFHWLFLVGLIALVWALSSAWAEKAGAQERGDRGYLNKYVGVCQVTYIDPITVDMLEDQIRIESIVRDKGFSSLSPQDYTRGSELYFGGCGTLAEPYTVVIYKVDGDYALMTFDARHGFEPEFYIIRLQDFHPDGGMVL